MSWIHFFSKSQNSLSGNRCWATIDHINKAAVAHPVNIRTQTDGHPTSTNFPLSPTEVDQPVRSIAEYMLARENIMWKKEYEYVIGLTFSFSSCCSSTLSNGSKGLPAPSSPKPTWCYNLSTNTKSSVQPTMDPSKLTFFFPFFFLLEWVLRVFGVRGGSFIILETLGGWVGGWFWGGVRESYWFC